MNGPCICGDYMCPSCGPAQGYDPKFELFCEKIADRIEALLDGIAVLDGPQMDDLLETITDKLIKILNAQEAAEERLADEHFPE